MHKICSLAFLLTLFQMQAPTGPKPRHVLPITDEHRVTNIMMDDGRCTGFFISPHIVLTCAHCVEGEGTPFLKSGGSLGVLYKGHEAAADDFAILYSVKASKEWFELDPSPLRLGTPLLVIAENPQIFVYPLSYVSDMPDTSYVVMGRIRPGDSGSPVLNLEAKVAAIVYAYQAATGEVGFLAPISQVVEKIKELGIPLN